MFKGCFIDLEKGAYSERSHTFCSVLLELDLRETVDVFGSGVKQAEQTNEPRTDLSASRE